MSWIELVRRNVGAADQLRKGIRGTRKAILATWLAVEAADENVKDLFRGLDEQGIQAEVDALTPNEALSRIPLLSPRTTATKEALIRCLAVALRTLEQQLWSLAGTIPQQREKPTVVEYDGFSAYLLMRAPRHRTAKTGESFRRRGLRRTRLLPRKLGAFTVRLTREASWNLETLHTTPGGLGVCAMVVENAGGKFYYNRSSRTGVWAEFELPVIIRRMGRSHTR
ncbi:hypothetical protein [Bradyrhizobium ganzhouense]|uniref:hypothetical protein n=1 Tax=Bradyrhizobium ganzhouense TaxID=1179767 RepID=UPI003CF61EA1